VVRIEGGVYANRVATLVKHRQDGRYELVIMGPDGELTSQKTTRTDHEGLVMLTEGTGSAGPSQRGPPHRPTHKPPRLRHDADDDDIYSVDEDNPHLAAAAPGTAGRPIMEEADDNDIYSIDEEDLHRRPSPPAAGGYPGMLSHAFSSSGGLPSADNVQIGPTAEDRAMYGKFVRLKTGMYAGKLCVVGTRKAGRTYRIYLLDQIDGLRRDTTSVPDNFEEVASTLAENR
jgi:hypothetical protein